MTTSISSEAINHGMYKVSNRADSMVITKKSKSENMEQKLKENHKTFKR